MGRIRCSSLRKHILTERPGEKAQATRRSNMLKKGKEKVYGIRIFKNPYVHGYITI